MLKKKISILSLLAFISLFSYQSQASPHDSSAYLKLYEDSLKHLQFGRIDVHKTEKQKTQLNNRFFAMMQKALNLPDSYNYPFDSLTTIARLESPDKRFRIINWNFPKQDGTQEYFGFIQALNPKTKKYQLYVLTDASEQLSNEQSKVLTADKWLGMLYYKIIEEKADGKPQYVLLAWKGYDKQLNKKVIDVLSFNSDGSPVFGKSVFSHLPSSFKGASKRIIFQYSSSVSMTLDYDPKKNMILFDHLGPSEDGLEGQYQFYGPSFQTDGLAFKDGKWNFVENVDARNASHNDSKFNDPEKSDNQVNKKPIYSPH